MAQRVSICFFFFNDTATTEIYTLSLHDALPIFGITGIILTKLDGDARGGAALSMREVTQRPIKFAGVGEKLDQFEPFVDRKSTRLNSSHANISYAVFCLKKKKLLLTQLTGTASI